MLLSALPLITAIQENMSEICEVCQIDATKCYCELDSDEEQQLLKEEEDADILMTKEYYQQIIDAKNRVMDAYEYLRTTSQKQVPPCLENLHFDELFEFLYPDLYEDYTNMFVVDNNIERDELENSSSSDTVSGVVIVGKPKEDITQTEQPRPKAQKVWNIL